MELPDFFIDWISTDGNVELQLLDLATAGGSPIASRSSECLAYIFVKLLARPYAHQAKMNLYPKLEK